MGLGADMSITQTLRDIMPMDVAKELTFTGRILNGKQAKEVGLVPGRDDPFAEAMALAEEVVANPDAVRAGKALYERAGTRMRGRVLNWRLRCGRAVGRQSNRSG